jgi:hypothetical protein
MSADAVQLPIPAVREHSGSVQGVAQAVGEARGAVREVTMDTQAYGKLCQFLPALLEPVFVAAVQALTGSEEALRETALGLRVVADTAEATDAAGARRITAAGPETGQLPELPL